MTAQALGFDRPMAQLARRRVATATSRSKFLAAAAICGDASVAARRGDRASGRSPQFGFVRLSDRFTTGSSIMPQKRNPDAAELVRAKAGRIIGALIALLVGDEGPAARLFQGHAGGQGAGLRRRRQPALALAAMTGMVARPAPDAERLRAAAGAGYSTATDLADWLVRGSACRSARRTT